MKEMTIYLQGLTCANCAGKIEVAVNKMKETKEAQINLVKQEMYISLQENAAEDVVFDKVKKTVHKYEPEVEVTTQKKVHAHRHDCCCCSADDCHGHTQEEEGSIKKTISRFVIGIFFFVAANLIEGIWQVPLFLVAYFIFGYDVLWRAMKNIAKGQVFDENFLMSLSTIGAMAIGEMPEAVFVMLFYQVGEAFQDYAVTRSRKSITSLMDIRPDYANLVDDNGNIAQVAPEYVKKGDLIQVKAGEKIPLDGVVKSGWAMLDTLALTGEAVPRRVDVGSMVLSGCINQDGLLEIEVTKPFGESTVMKILELVENAAGKKSKTEKFITKFARVYTPAVVVLAVLLAFVPPLLGYGALSVWFGRALMFLVVSCPCALVLSVPLSYFAGIGAASKNGILVKGSNYLDALCHTDCIVFDKTGTLTKGEFAVTQMVGDENMLALVAAGEAMSNHPIAKAIVAKYTQMTNQMPQDVSDYQEKGGFGILYQVDGKQMAVGNNRLMEQMDIAYQKYDGIGSVVYVAADNQYLGYLVVDDTIKENCKEALQDLKKYGIKELVMLSGDRKETAETIGHTLGIDRIYAELLPQDKVTKLEEILQKQNPKSKTAFVGDGINDAPVLAGADVGIAMGAIGSDAAIEAADVVLMDDDIAKLQVGLRIAKNTRKIVLQNIVFALGVKVIMLLLIAIGMSTMWLAVFADVGVAVLAICNAMRRK